MNCQIYFSNNIYFISLEYKHNCSDVVIPECQRIPGYTKTVVSPSLQRRYAAYIRSKIRYNESDTCSQGRKEIVCAENLPACMDGTVGFLCRDECLRFFNRCKSPFFYGRDMCMEFPEKEDSHNHVVCKQTHWPRSENWPLTETPSATPTAISGETDLPRALSIYQEIPKFRWGC